MTTRLASLAALAVVLCTAPAWAQEEAPAPPPPAASASAQANEAYARGMQLMSEQQYAAAAEQFDIASRFDPMMTAARVAKGHAFILLGDRFVAMGEKDQARLMFGKALEANPRLADDANFSVRYRAVTSPEARAVPTYQKSEYEVEKIYPRKDKIFGVGLTLGLEGIFGIQVGLMLAGIINPTFTYTPYWNWIDISVKVLPLKTKWSPFIGAGYSYMWGWETCASNGYATACGGLGHYNFFHIDLGVQLMTKHGFAMNLGVNITNIDNSEIRWIPIPFIDWSWYF
ncbi:MAG TPA: hypothetical protein VGQ83_20035 [Polyangia bacterium]|jgi:tetratricopeptide (TPR) repeat protein